MKLPNTHSDCGKLFGVSVPLLPQLLDPTAQVRVLLAQLHLQPWEVVFPYTHSLIHLYTDSTAVSMAVTNQLVHVQGQSSLLHVLLQSRHVSFQSTQSGTKDVLLQPPPPLLLTLLTSCHRAQPPRQQGDSARSSEKEANHIGHFLVRPHVGARNAQYF